MVTNVIHVTGMILLSLSVSLLAAAVNLLAAIPVVGGVPTLTTPWGRRWVTSGLFGFSLIPILLGMIAGVIRLTGGRLISWMILEISETLVVVTFPRTTPAKPML
tara:strand:- start:645 stop:959 length:315 start_codon:yes stop_codon:yes gene_type:complete